MTTAISAHTAPLGQTTNPSLIAKNPEVMHLVESGHRLTEREEAAEYRKIVQAVSPLVGDSTSFNPEFRCRRRT